MNNQFVGDIGDYTKLGILRELEKVGFSIGINWYWTPCDLNRTGGGITDFLYVASTPLDLKLHNVLLKIDKKSLPRTINTLMDSELFSCAKYYDVMLDFYTDKNQKEKRAQWHRQALELLQKQDIVFLDPDNAFETKSIKRHHKNGYLYAGYEEAADYYYKGASVVVYNHLAMFQSKEAFIANRLRPIYNFLPVDTSDIFYVEANRRQVRYYLFISQPRHTERIKNTLEQMYKDGWCRFIEMYAPFDEWPTQ